MKESTTIWEMISGKSHTSVKSKRKKSTFRGRWNFVGSFHFGTVPQSTMKEFRMWERSGGLCPVARKFRELNAIIAIKVQCNLEWCEFSFYWFFKKSGPSGSKNLSHSLWLSFPANSVSVHLLQTQQTRR